VAWFATDRYDGFGIVCGAVSGNLEMLELEGRAIAEGTLDAFAQAMYDNGHGELWDRINAGYVEQSPSGGRHWLYRVDGPARRNLKLARRPATAEELATEPDDRLKVLIETRGEAGYVVVAPSAGRTHASGLPWLVLAGSPAQIPVLTLDERDTLHMVATMFDTVPAHDPVPIPLAPGATGDTGGLRPGDDYNDRANWSDILGPSGWTLAKRIGGTCYGWTRPGKDPRDGLSATTGRNDGDNLYVFSSSTVFEPERAYSKFAAYALLEHGNDYSAAASALRAAGYGAPPPDPPRPAAAVAASAEVAGDDRPVQLTYSTTEDGNALRLVDTYGETLRYCPQRLSWLRWDGHRWRWDEAGHVYELARGIARALPDTDRATSAHRLKSLTSAGLTSMVRIARTDPRVIVDLGRLDAQAFELNTPGGVVDLRTGKLRDPDPAALHTRSTNVTPDYDTAPTRWLAFLATTFAGDPAMTTYVQRLLGLSYIGRVLESVLPFGWGSGANGKTTLLNVAQRVGGVGDDGYAQSAPAELLLSTAHRGHPTELARLAGARLVVASELEDGEKFAEARIKLLTGKDTLTARFMGRDFFSFTPTHTIWLLANEQPAVRAGGPAFWRRLRLLPFLHTVPKAAQVIGLDDELYDIEGPAILAWIVAGAADYLREGLAEPSSVRAATDAYELEQDTVQRFVGERCDLGDPNAQHMQCRVADVRAAYETWCRAEGESPVTAKAFTGALRTRFGVQSNRSNSARFYSGIRLTDVSPDPAGDSSEPPDDYWQQ
jgi:putative DNA primase/helicase